MDTVNPQAPIESTLEQQPSSPPPKTPFHSKTLLITIAVFIIIMIGLTTYLLAARSKPISQPPPTISPTLTQPSPTPLFSETSMKEDDPTANPDSIGANWKTYTDPELGFSVKYPEGWTTSEDYQQIIARPHITINPAYYTKFNWIVVSRYPNPKGIDVSTYVDEMLTSKGIEIPGGGKISLLEDKNLRISTQKTVVDGMAAEIVTGLPGLSHKERVFIAKGGYIYDVMFEVNQAGDHTYNDILSTFQFIN